MGMIYKCIYCGKTSHTDRTSQFYTCSKSPNKQHCWVR